MTTGRTARFLCVAVSIAEAAVAAECTLHWALLRVARRRNCRSARLAAPCRRTRDTRFDCPGRRWRFRQKQDRPAPARCRQLRKGFRIGVGLVAAGAPFHVGKKSSGASFDEIGANCDTPTIAVRSPRRQIFPLPRYDRESSRPARLLFATRPSRQISRCHRASTVRATCSP